MTLHEEPEHGLRYVLCFEAAPAQLATVRQAVAPFLSWLSVNEGRKQKTTRYHYCERNPFHFAPQDPLKTRDPQIENTSLLSIFPLGEVKPGKTSQSRSSASILAYE